MKLTKTELVFFRNQLLHRSSYKGMEIHLGAKSWEDWMEGTLQKLTDELYPIEGDPI